MPPGAGPQHMGAIGQQWQARAKLPAKHRVAIAAATAHGGKAGDGFEVIGGIAGRNGLARDFGSVTTWTAEWSWTAVTTTSSSVWVGALSWAWASGDEQGGARQGQRGCQQGPNSACCRERKRLRVP